MDRRYYEALELQKVENFRKNALKFIETLMDRSGLVDSDINSRDKVEYANNILRRSCKLINARNQELPGFEREVGFVKYIKKVKESLKLINGEKYSEDEVAKYKVLSLDSTRVYDVLTKWNIESEDFFKMVYEYKKDGMTISFAEQIVLQIDCVLGKKK